MSLNLPTTDTSQAVNGIADVGNILLQANAELEGVRQQLEQLDRHSEVYESLKQVLQKTETSLRQKAEAVLKSVESNSLTVLPSLPPVSSASPTPTPTPYLPPSTVSSSSSASSALAAFASSSALARPGQRSSLYSTLLGSTTTTSPIVSPSNASLAPITIHQRSGRRRRHTQLLQRSLATLPSQQRGGNPEPGASLTVLERMQESKEAEWLLKPHVNSGRNYILEKYGLVQAGPRPASESQATVKPRPVDRYGSVGRLVHGRVAPEPVVLPKIYRENPRLFPTLTTDDTSQGLINLLNRRMIPHFVDLSPAFSSGSAPLKQQPVKFHHYHDQFDRTHTLTAAHKFNLANVKLDLAQTLLTPEPPATPKLEARSSAAVTDAVALATRSESRPPLEPEEEHDLLVARAVEEQGKEMKVREDEEEKKRTALKPTVVSDLSGQTQAMDAAHLEQNARGYNELLDTYSLHQFIIRKGKTVTSTPEFVSFRRKYAHMWGAIAAIIQKLEDLLLASGVVQALVNGQRVAELAKDSELTQPTVQELLSCLATENEDQKRLAAAVRLPAYKFSGPQGREYAASKINATIRMWLVRRWYLKHRRLILSAIVIQRAYRRRLTLRRTRALIEKQWKEKLKRWKSTTQRQFKLKWNDWLSGARVAVHIPSMSLKSAQRQSMSNLQARQNAQLAARLCEVAVGVGAQTLTPASSLALPPSASSSSLSSSSLSALSQSLSALASSSSSASLYATHSRTDSRASLDINASTSAAAASATTATTEASQLDVVYVAPFIVSPELQQYYLKLLEVGGVKQAATRVKIMTPENYARFPDYFSLARVALYSPKLLKQIKDFIHGRPAFIVPNMVGEEDLHLAVELDLPLLGADPRTYAHYASKSGARRIFAAAELPEVLGASDIYDELDLYIYFSKLIVDHLDVGRWILKIDNEFGGRGTAFFDVAHIKSVMETLRLEKEHGESHYRLPDVLANARDRVSTALKKALPKHAVLCTPAVYHNSWSEFAAAFFRVGGIIEAVPPQVMSSPSVNMFIEPDGTVNLLSSHDQIFNTPYVFSGATFPSAAPANLLHNAALAIGRECYKHKMMGHVGVDFILWCDDHSYSFSPPVVSLSSASSSSSSASSSSSSSTSSALSSSSLALPSSATSSSSSSPTVLRLWAVDLNLRYTDTHASFQLFHFLMKGTYHYSRHLSKSHNHSIPLASVPSAERCRYTVPPLPSKRAESKPVSGRTSVLSTISGFSDSDPQTPAREEERRYACIPYLYQPSLATVQFAAFFNMCRLKGVAFDLRQRVGTAFMMMDSLASGTIGLLCVDRSEVNALQLLCNGLEFLCSPTFHMKQTSHISQSLAHSNAEEDAHAGKVSLLTTRALLKVAIAASSAVLPMPSSSSSSPSSTSTPASSSFSLTSTSGSASRTSAHHSRAPSSRHVPS